MSLPNIATIGRFGGDQGPAHRAVARAEAELTKRRARHRELEETRQAARLDLARLERRLTSAYEEAERSGKEPTAGLLRDLRGAQERAAQPWAQRLEAAERVAVQALEARNAILSARFEELLEERAELALDLPERVRADLRSAIANVSLLLELGAQVERLAQQAGRRNLRVPALNGGLTRLRSELEQALERDVDAPLPAELVERELRGVIFARRGPPPYAPDGADVIPGGSGSPPGTVPPTLRANLGGGSNRSL